MLTRVSLDPHSKHQDWTTTLRIGRFLRNCNEIVMRGLLRSASVPATVIVGWPLFTGGVVCSRSTIDSTADTTPNRRDSAESRPGPRERFDCSRHNLAFNRA